MKIAIATAVYYPQINGVAVFSHNLAKGLAKRGHEVLVLTPSQDGKSHTKMVDGVKVAFLKSIDIKVYPDQIHEVPANKKLVYKYGLRASVWPRREIGRVLDDFRPDVVHVQVSDPIGLAVVAYARHHNIPVVTTEHNQPEVITESLKLPKLLKNGVNAMLSAYFRHRHGKGDFATMPTEKSIRNLLGKHGLKVPIAAVSNGVDLSAFGPGKATKEIYEKYGIPEGKPIVLYIGRVDPEKKVGVVIRAFERAAEKVPEAELVIVGDGVDKARVVKMAMNNPKIHFLGKVLPPDLYELYKVGTVFVTASEIETQGIVLIEAAATGLPLIAMDKSAVAEVCINGKNGCLCKPGSVEEMADAIVKILSDDEIRKRYAKESLAVADEHNFEKTLDKFENIYGRLVKKGGV